MTTILYISNVLFAIAMPVTHIVGYAAGAVALVFAWPYRRQLLREPVIIGMLFLLTYGAARTLVSAQPSVGWGAVAGYFSHWLLPLLLGYVMARTDPQKMPRLIQIFSLSFMGLFAVTFIAYLGLMPGQITIPQVGEFIFVESGLFKALRSHISVAAICLVLIFVHIHLLRGRASFRLSVVIIAVSLLVLVLTGSRGYYIAAMVSFAAYGAWYAVTTKKIKQLVFAIGIAAALAGTAYLTVPTLRERLNHTGPQDMNVRERLALYQVAIHEFKDRPLTGFGPGQGIKQSVYFTRLEPDMQGVGRHPHLHSFYLNFLADTGLIGLFLFAAIIYFLLRRLWRAGTSADAFTAALGRGLFWAFLAVLAGDCFDTLLLGPWTAMELFWLSGLVLGAAEKERGVGV